MAKWAVGDYIEVTSTHKFIDGYYGGYAVGDTGHVVAVRHNYLFVTFEGNIRHDYKVLKRECTKVKPFNRVLERIKLLHSRQSLKHPSMNKEYV